MGIFDKIGKKVSDAGQKTIQKTKEMSDTVKLNSGIAEEEKKMNDWYCQIGKLYVSIHSTDFEDEFQELVHAIQESEVKIAGYRKQIQNLNGLQCCISCGAEVQKDAAFCTICGTPMPKDEKSEVSDTEVCTHCGTKINKGNSFCVCCGTPIVQEEKLINSLPHLEEEITYGNEEDTAEEDIDETVDEQPQNQEIDSVPLFEEAVEVMEVYPQEDIVDLPTFSEKLVYQNEEDVDDENWNNDMKEVQRCENCGAEVEEGSYFCVECGSPVMQEMEEIVQVCTCCGAEVEEGSRFCAECGTPIIMNISEEIVCFHCGSRIEEDDIFCAGCGAKLS